MICKECEGQTFTAKKKGVQTGAYCKKCGKWQKWLKGSEIADLEDEVEVADCAFCSKEYLIPTAWGDGCLVGWISVPANFCPSCGKLVG